MANRSRTRSLFDVETDEWYVFKAPSVRKETTYRRGEYDILSVILSGVAHIHWEEEGRPRLLQAGSGDAMYLPGRLVRVESNEPSPRFMSITVQFHWRNPAPDLPYKVSDRLGVIRVLAESVLSIGGFADPNRQLIRNGYLGAMLAEYCRLAANEGEGLVGRVRRYVYDSRGGHISLDDLVKYVGMSKRQFEREYTALTGETPMRSVRRIRVEQAARQLGLASRWSLKEVAQGVGIYDEHELSRLLKKYVGLTAQQLRGGGDPSKQSK